jgi:steroid delta-isomerase-like uncharacterized protein
MALNYLSLVWGRRDGAGGAKLFIQRGLFWFAERRSTMSDENKIIARRLMEEGWNKAQLNVVDELMSTRCRFHDPVFPSLTEGAENFKKHIEMCRAGFPDLHFTIEDTIAERNEVVLHWSARGTHRGAFLGMPATNKLGNVSGTSILRMENGKIVEHWSDWNLLTLMEQLGLTAQAQAQSGKQPAKGQQRPAANAQHTAAQQR